MKLYELLLLVFIVGLLSGCSQTVPSGTTTTTNTEITQVVDTPVPVETPSRISLADFAVHNSKSDCWIAYDGKVYDITKYLPIHPGGSSKISPYCGTSSEFASAFTKQHGTSQVNKLVQQGIYRGELQ